MLLTYVDFSIFGIFKRTLCRKEICMGIFELNLHFKLLKLAHRNNLKFADFKKYHQTVGLPNKAKSRLSMQKCYGRKVKFD
jgi:hypothetical protein